MCVNSKSHIHNVSLLLGCHLHVELKRENKMKRILLLLFMLDLNIRSSVIFIAVDRDPIYNTTLVQTN